MIVKKKKNDIFFPPFLQQPKGTILIHFINLFPETLQPYKA